MPGTPTPARTRRVAVVPSVLLALTVAVATALTGLALLSPPATADPAPLLVDRSGVPATWHVQLSDPASVAFTATSGLGAAAITATPSGLPAGLTVSGSNGSFAISGTPSGPPGTSNATVTVADGLTSVPLAVAVVVDPENASVANTGATSFSGPDIAAETVPVTLTAQVTQEADGHPGPLTAATVAFTNVDPDPDDDNTTMCAAAPVAANGTATCSFSADMSWDDTEVYQVALSVGGSFTGHSAAPTPVTVTVSDDLLPLPDTSITSGPSGWVTGTSATFGLASTTTGATFICRLDTAKVSCPGSSVALTGLTAGSHRLSVVAVDADDDRDESPATRDFAVPVDDAALAPTGRWKRKHSASAYLGTVAQTKRKGAALSYKVADARELALLVRTGKRHGAVKVYLDDALLATVKTSGKKNGAKLVKLAHFPAARSGTLRIVTTTGKTVQVDGLGVSTYPF